MLLLGQVVAGPPAPPVLRGVNEFADAAADRARFPLEDQPYIYHLTTAAFSHEERILLENALMMIVPSLSHKTDLAYQLPVKVSDTLYRIDLRGLGWDKTWHQAIAPHYPYYWIGDPNYKTRKYAPRVIRADWFVADIYDQVQTKNAQFLLLYGRDLKDAEDFKKFWGVQKENEYVFGMIEERSGVSVQKVRQIENYTTSKRGYFWETKDSRIIAGRFDPLANLHQRDKVLYDASEYIVGMFKVKNGKAGCAQAYLLAFGNSDPKVKEGTLQEKAPVDIVEDHTNTRGREIRNSSSCVYCHLQGIQPPTQNGYRRFITSDGRLKADWKSTYEIQRYHGSDLEKEVKLNQDLYASFISMCNGLTPAQSHRHYQICVQRYIGHRSIEDMARELSVIYGTDRVTPHELELALSWYSKQYGLPQRLVDLAEGHGMTYEQSLDLFPFLQKVFETWQKH